MIITVPMLREAGLTEAQINRVVEIADREVMLQRREQNRIRQQNHRARNADARDARDKRDKQVSKDPSFLPNQGKKEGRKKHLLAESWQLSDEDRAYARTKGWPDNRIETEGERFRLYYVTKATLITNEHLTWCKWVMSPIQNGGQGGSFQLRPRQQPESPITAAANRIRHKLGLVEGGDDPGRVSQGRLPKPGSVHDTGGDEPDEVPEGGHRVRECANHGYSDTIKMAAKSR